MNKNQDTKRYVLLFSGPDTSGIVASVTGRIFAIGGNINDSIQHHEPEDDTFFMRVAWDMNSRAQAELKKHATNAHDVALIEAQFQEDVKKFQLSYHIARLKDKLRVAIMVSKQLHCLYDLLLQWREGELACVITSIISNHQEAHAVAKWFDVPFHYTPTKGGVVDETEQLRILQAEKVDTVVLARYMRILSPNFVQHYPQQIINIHHSFLPAFVGARPYQQAFARGVKIIGATSHYVTSELDQGPIIEQDVTRVSHRDSLNEMIHKGRDLERTVLARALRLHLGRRILVYNNKTIIFI